MERTSADARFKKIQADFVKIKELLLREGVKAIPRHSRVIVVDFDATDALIHGHQEGRFYHGYYGNYCYLPLYGFCGDIPLWAQLRTADRDGSDGTLEALQEIVRAIRKRFGKRVIITVRTDSGFCREPLMSWIESQRNVHYVFGLARNVRLERELIPAYWECAAQLDEDLVFCAKAAGADQAPNPQGTARVFTEFNYLTLDSWSQERRVVGKAEITEGKKNPRFETCELRRCRAPVWRRPLWARFGCGSLRLPHRLR